MKTVFRWFGPENDPIPLKHIRQIPSVEGVVVTLPGFPVGEAWDEEKIAALHKTVRGGGLTMEVVESVEVHEDIKLGAGKRDLYIENYAETLRRLSKFGVKAVCYNFMPVFDWTRSDLAYELPDGSTVLYYDQGEIDKVTDPRQMAEDMKRSSGGAYMPGWDAEKLDRLIELFELYKSVDGEKLFENYAYFLGKIIPVAEECDIKMAVHPDDPPWNIFGLPRIVNNQKNIERILRAVDSPYNGLTLCTGSLGSDPDNDLPAIIRRFGEAGLADRIHFVHARNVKIIKAGLFHESAHLSKSGSYDMYEIMKALRDAGFDGYMRPDHGRMIWGENGRPGYGLYDRAIGAEYLNGLWEAIVKSEEAGLR
ncbi:MAG: mannonate dehydratase [Oscillospiraceae bacterium]|jgi:mannonate dehydratase|nr:mannonate dehydratase [Oscillospiraceae bacterium]